MCTSMMVFHNKQNFVYEEYFNPLPIKIMYNVANDQYKCMLH